MRYFAILLSMLLLPISARAGDVLALRLHPLAQPTQTITLAQMQGHPTIIALWRADCAPCLLELAQLPRIARQHPDVMILLVSLQDEVATQKAIQNIPIPGNLQVLLAADSDITVMDASGNSRHRLPYSAAITADGTICRQHYGMLGSATLNQWIGQC